MSRSSARAPLSRARLFVRMLTPAFALTVVVASAPAAVTATTPAGPTRTSAAVKRTPVAGPAGALDLSDPLALCGLEWRSVGPYRGGRVTAVTGVIGQSGVYY